jgi:hypothetical protein
MSNQFGYHAGQFANNYSEAENRQFTAIFGEITEGFKVAMGQGLSSDHETVQDLVRQHYEFCLQFWKPDRETYKSLAMSYIIPSPYQESYEAVAKGLGKFHYNAIVIFADKNL